MVGWGACWEPVFRACLGAGTSVPHYGAAMAEPGGPSELEGIDLAALFDQLADGVVVAGPDGRIRLSNRRADDLLGYAAGGLTGQQITDLVPERHRFAHEVGFARVCSGGPGRIVGGPALRVAARRADASEVDVELTLGTVGKPGSAAFVCVASLRDARDQVALERTVDLAQYLQASIDVANRLRHADDVAGAYAGVLPALCARLDWDIAGL